MDGPPPQPSAPPSNLNIPISLRKCKRFCTDHLNSHFVSYDCLNPFFHQFFLSLSSVSIPRSYDEAILVTAWKKAMDKEMDALASRGTWDLISPPKGIVVVGCC